MHLENLNSQISSFPAEAIVKDAADKAKTQKNGPGVDKVEISSSKTDLERDISTVKAALEHVPDVRQEKIDEILAKGPTTSYNEAFFFPRLSPIVIAML